MELCERVSGQAPVVEGFPTKAEQGSHSARLASHPPNPNWLPTGSENTDGEANIVRLLSYEVDFVPRPAPPPPHQGQADHPGHQHRVEELATPHFTISDWAATAADHHQAHGNGDQGHKPRIEKIASPDGRGRPETAEERADKGQRGEQAAVDNPSQSADPRRPPECGPRWPKPTIGQNPSQNQPQR